MKNNIFTRQQYLKIYSPGAKQAQTMSGTSSGKKQAAKINIKSSRNPPTSKYLSVLCTCAYPLPQVLT